MTMMVSEWMYITKPLHSTKLHPPSIISVCPVTQSLPLPAKNPTLSASLTLRHTDPPHHYPPAIYPQRPPPRRAPIFASLSSHIAIPTIPGA